MKQFENIVNAYQKATQAYVDTLSTELNVEVPTVDQLEETFKSEIERLQTAMSSPVNFTNYVQQNMKTVQENAKQTVETAKDFFETK